jgi:hypothetical protein
MEEKIIDCTQIHSKEDLHRIFRQILCFPNGTAAIWMPFTTALRKSPEKSGCWTGKLQKTDWVITAEKPEMSSLLQLCTIRI